MVRKLACLKMQRVKQFLSLFMMACATVILFITPYTLAGVANFTDFAILSAGWDRYYGLPSLNSLSQVWLVDKWVWVDMTKYSSSSPIKVEHAGDFLTVEWQGADEITYQLVLDISGENALMQSIAYAQPGASSFTTLAQNMQPDFPVRIGSRQGGDWPYIFFDSPDDRSSQTFSSLIDLKSVKVSSEGSRVKLVFSSISSGSFSGDLVCHIYDGSPLLYWEAAMSTDQSAVAYLYEGLFHTAVPMIVYKDNITKQIVRESPSQVAATLKVVHRTVMAEYATGTIAFFPPPHASAWPVNKYAHNNGYVKAGAGLIGIRQDKDGDGSHDPWVDAFPGTVQRMGVFLLLSPTQGEDTLERVKRYTHGDQFKIIDGYKTFTEHYHPEMTKQEMEGNSTPVLEFKEVMKSLNVQIVLMAEFHCCGDFNGRDVGTVRFDQLKAMFDLSKNYSDNEFVMLPGEEANAHFDGHWSYFFPKPVYFVKSREANEPFVETLNPYGTVYRLGNAEETYEMLRLEGGLAFTSHPRVKGSRYYPDNYASKDFFQDDDVFLGGEWKAVPSDLSEPRLGRRALKLLDEMCQWGYKKKLVGAGDTFYLDMESELYSQMNINYLKLPNLPSLDDGDWSEVVDVLRQGDFFVSTGEVLLHDHTISETQVSVDVEWTFPLGFAEIIWGEGAQIKTHTITMSESREFGRENMNFPIDLSSASWVRLEIWDIARNGAFTQPTWLKEPVQRGPSIESFTLINADNNYPIPAFDPVGEGAVLDYATLPTSNLSIRANASPMSPDQVRFAYNGDPSFQVENNYPYDFTAAYTPWELGPGAHTITATSVVDGVDGTPLTLNFSIVGTPEPPKKRVLVISETNHVFGVDKIYLDALGAGPVTIPGGGTVPGLGYNVVLFDDDNYTETTFTNADGDLVFIFMSVGSGSVNDTHGDDPLPVISMEPYLCDNRTGRSSFWFTDTEMEDGGEGSSYILDVVLDITDNSHPITSIFPLGQLTLFTAPQRQYGMRGTFGSGVQVLGVDTQGTPEVLLAVAEAGATLVAGAPGTISPAPAKRAIMAIHEDSYGSATEDAVFIFQRMVQWAIGDPVVAGGTP